MEGQIRKTVSLGPWSAPHGQGGILLGLLLLLGGTVLVLIAGGVIPVDPRSVHVPPLVLAVCGAIFAMPGLFVAQQALRHRARNRRLEVLRAEHPREPWRWDHAWDPERARDDSGEQLRRGAVGLAFLILFLAPFHWVAFAGPALAWPFAIGCVVFDLIILLALGVTLHQAMQRLKYGVTYVVWDRFPILLGGRTSLRWETAADPTAFRRLSFTLRCVATRKVTRPSSDGPETRIVHEQVWSREQVLEHTDRLRRDLPVQVAFDLPADLPGSGRSLELPWLWVLEVRGDADGVDFHGRYALPVYHRSGTLGERDLEPEPEAASASPPEPVGARP